MEYLVTKITELNSKKIKIELNYEIYFSLYKGEVRRFKIVEGKELEAGSYLAIFEEILPKRASDRCINLLASRSMTEKELRRKLHEGYYPEDIIDKTIDKLIRYNLVNDESYVYNYLETYRKSKSIRQMKQDLLRRGISGELMIRMFDDTDINEESSIHKLMMKKRFNPESASEQEKNKFANYLLRKGYGFDLIRRCVLK